MATKAVKEKGYSVADEFVKLAEDMDTITDAVPDIKTKQLVELFAGFKKFQPMFEKAFGSMRLEIIKRATELKDKMFDSTEKAYYTDLDDETTLTVGRRQQVLERQGAMSWLERKKPELISKVTRRVIKINDADVVYDVTHELDKMILNQDLDLKKIRNLMRQLNVALTSERVLDQKLVGQAVKDGLLKESIIEKRLFELKDSYAITIAKKKEDDAENETE